MRPAHDGLGGPVVTLARAREAGLLSFAYEQELVLPIDGKQVPVKTDFTVEAGGRRFFWEHLGMLDVQIYAADWRRRREGYAAAGLAESLVTTHDLGGLIQERIDAVVEALVGGKLTGEAGRFSDHHYRLY